MNYTEIVRKMRGRHGLKDTDSVGIAGFHCKDVVVSEEESDVEVVMTTVDVDLDSEVVLPSGVDLSYFNHVSQRKVFVDHEYDMGSNVGAARFVNPFPNAQNPIGLKARIHIYRKLKDPRCDDLMERIRQAGMGLSVGFIPVLVDEPTREEVLMYPGASSVVRKWKMLEVSFTAMPCNVKCQTVGLVTPSPKRVTIEPQPRRATI